MKKNWKPIPLALLMAATVLTGCTQPQSDRVAEKPPEAVNPADGGSAPGEGIQLPDSKVDIMNIEGMEEEITSYFYNGGDFKTYAPEDLLIESLDDEENGGAGHWFYANYQDQKREDVYLHLYFYPESQTTAPDLTEPGTLPLLADLEGRFVELETKQYPWATAAYRLNQGIGYAYVGEHEGRYFAAVLHYPLEFAEGFGPRVQLVFNNFIWTDTDEPLMP